MNNNVGWIVELEIKPGQLENFKSVMQDMINSTHNEIGALAYEWHFNGDENEVLIYERYQDSQAVLTHMENFGPYAERFQAATTHKKMTLLGKPNQEIQEMFGIMNPSYLPLKAGFNRFD